MVTSKLKGIAHPKMEVFQDIQDVDEFVSSSEQI